MSPVFSEKLDGLDDTVRLLKAFDAGSISGALSEGRGRHALAVGSGGSAIAASFLSRCRDTLGLGPTTIETPMDLVLGGYDLSGSDVWLFSAGADNADIVAAAVSARQRRCRRLHIVTRGPSGAAAEIVAASGGTVHAVPAATIQDGYLATHSMIATVGALLLASDAVAHDARGRDELVAALLVGLAESRTAAARSAMAERFASLGRRDTILILADPQLGPISTLIDTSIWEASLCSVQRVDFRNFAHGRHGWIHHRADETLIVALTAMETREVWAPIASVLPPTIRVLSFDLGDGGRLSNALGIIDGLTMIEAMGQAVSVDPGKPGYGQFGPAIYDNRSLEAVASGMPASVRHKRAAMARSDERGAAPDPLLIHARNRLEKLVAATIGGLVFDYDGTLVATAERFSPPRAEIVEQLVRLDAAGVRLGIATGRGNSAGKDLRKVLPPDMHPRVVVGYYNGSHVVPLDVDIEREPPIADPIIAATADWLRSHQDLFVASNYKVGPLQITINAELLRRPYRFRRDMVECPLIQTGQVRVTGSGHSFDIIAATATKLRVVETIRNALSREKEILCFGDSGSRSGNDHALLSHPFGISVGEVCGAPNGCWSLFGDHPSGPDALLNALYALVPFPPDDGIRLDVHSMALDTPYANGT
ncbi:HAD hydrolase family protein [Croceibacterium sp. TMG7-5b_MA50]|uniref:HAD hydrolase family protein n=1 Tax=Croceibacterium sp. TMG7-5b_MA50 TaxID=3121290 RepID=UPI00322194BC